MSWEERTEPAPGKKETLISAAIVVTLALAYQIVAYIDAPTPPEARCTTDTDCARLCPKDEPDCDGGPEPAKVRT